MGGIIKKILIFIIIVGFLGGAYMYFFKGSSLPINGSALVSSNGITNVVNAEGVSNQIEGDTAFLSTLLGLNSIKIDPSIFMSSSFSALSDNTVKIEGGGEVGRENPFADIKDNTVFVPTDVKTDTQVITLPVAKPTKR